MALSASQELTQCFDLCTGLYRMYLVETSKWHALRTQAVPASPRKLRRARRSCGYGHDYLLGMMATQSFARQELDEYPSRITQRLLASYRRVFRPFRVWRILRRARRRSTPNAWTPAARSGFPQYGLWRRATFRDRLVMSATEP